MLTWANDRESFGNFPSVDTLLENKTKDELISIIKEMFERVPELINILERSEAIKSSRKNPVTPEIYRRQIREAMEYTDNWHNRFAGANEITSIVAIEDRFADNDDFENAFIVYQAVIGETLENYYMVHDEGEITEEIDSAIEGISFCLSKQKESGNRIEMLKALFEVKKWDITQGGYGIGDNIPEILSTDTAPKERKIIVDWIDSAIKEGVSGWGRIAWGDFLLSIFETDSDNEGFLKKAEELGLYTKMFEKFVSLKQIDKAVKIAKEHLTSSDWERLNVSKKMSEFGFANEAINFAAEGLSDCKDNRLREWLAEEYEKRKDLLKALDLYLEIWQNQPGLSNYKNVKRLANTLEKWPILERGLIESLEKRQDYDLLTEIYLFEKNWSLAWYYADKIQRTWVSYLDIRLKLAEASEKDCLDRSAKVYYDYAEILISRRGRNNYAEASSLLKKMLNIFIRTDLQEEGEELIMKVRNNFRKLPAFQDEMNNVGL